MQLLLTRTSRRIVVGEIQEELDIPNSTLSHHLDKLKAEELVAVRRESTSCATRPTRKRCRSYCNFFTRNAARGTMR